MENCRCMNGSGEKNCGMAKQDCQQCRTQGCDRMRPAASAANGSGRSQMQGCERARSAVEAAMEDSGHRGKQNCGNMAWNRSGDMFRGVMAGYAVPERECHKRDAMADCACAVPEGDCHKRDAMERLGASFPVVMAYVPWQQWGKLYSADCGLMEGTVFEDLNQIFCGVRC